ncbi:hypothetical protein Fmac_025922 [Flemingia macrophylla]|uniref:Hydroxyproline-rich glycoprotein family protein n=1 Tax=Flemingia macrophylla TaxID=520843 RepID=A0ABD1LDZ0_9FABA
MATKHQKLHLEQHNQQDQNKFYYHFMYKATIVLFFFVILPLFPSQAPQFINHSLLTRNWELLHLLVVGIAVSYGLFSRRNNETDKDDNNNKFDTAQSLVSKFLQVSSFFEEGENPVESDETKVQTWNNQHHRNQPKVVVAPRLNHSDLDHHSVENRPLLLPIRSLKSRLSDEANRIGVQSLNDSTSSKRFSSNTNAEAQAEAEADDDDDVDVDVQSLNRSTSSKRFSSSFEDVDVQSLSKSTASKRFSSCLNNKNLEVEDKKQENVVVLPSPIPWRSRSGKMEPKHEVDDDASNTVFPSKEESRPVKSQTPSRVSSRTSSLSPSPNLAPFSSESLAKNAEDLVRKKGFNYKSCPPPPPPPPPMLFHRSVSMKPKYGGSFTEGPSFDKELKRSFTMSVGKTKKYDEEKPSMQQHTTFRSDKFMGHASVPLVFEPAEKGIFLDKVLVEESEDDEEDDTETEDDDVGDIRKSPPLNSSKNNHEASSCETIGDEGPDVDKKADEFIAKFREQIRLQRIESIKRSTRSTSRHNSR